MGTYICDKCGAYLELGAAMHHECYADGIRGGIIHGRHDDEKGLTQSQLKAKRKKESCSIPEPDQIEPSQQ